MTGKSGASFLFIKKNYTSFFYGNNSFSIQFYTCVLYINICKELKYMYYVSHAKMFRSLTLWKMCHHSCNQRMWKDVPREAISFFPFSSFPVDVFVSTSHYVLSMAAQERKKYRMNIKSSKAKIKEIVKNEKLRSNSIRFLSACLQR